MSYRSVVPVFSKLFQPGGLPFITIGIHLQEWNLICFLILVSIDTDDEAIIIINLALITIGSFLDFSLEETSLNCREYTAKLVYLLEIRPCLGFESIRDCLYII